jgi:HSP20 family protein
MGVEMIIINFKPTVSRSSSALPESAAYYFSNLANWHLTIHPHIWRPPTDVYETEEKFVVIVEIAGMDEEGFEITLNNNLLTVHGERSHTMERKSYFQMEIHFGEFVTEVEFSNPIDSDGCVAEYHQGFLLVSLPKLLKRNIILEKEG